MAHHAIKVVRPCRTRVKLDRRDLRLAGAELVYQVMGQVGRHRQGRALRHIHHHGVLGLIVQRHHLDRDPLEVEEGQGEGEGAPEHQAENFPLALALDERHQDAAEELFDLLRLLVLALLGLLQIGHGGPQPLGDGQVGREDEGGKEGDKHGRRAQGRDRLHVGAHHAGDEAHGQQGGNDGEGGEDGGVAHLRHGLDGDIVTGVALLQPAAVDIFYHHDGIIHQDTDGEDEGEEADPVDGVVPDPSHEDGHEQDDGNDQHDHDSRAQGAEGPPHQEEDPAGGDEEFEDELADLVVRRGAVIAGDTDFDVVGDALALEFLHPGEDGIGHAHAVGQFLLGDGDGHRRHAIGLDALGGGRTRVVGDQMPRVLRTLGDPRHVPDIDGLTLMSAHHQAADIVHALQEGTGGDGEMGAAGLETPGEGLGIGGLDGLSHLIQADPVAGQALGLDVHRDLLAATTDDEGAGRILNLLDGLKHVLGQQPQLAIVHVRQAVAVRVHRPEGKGHDGDIIDALALDQRLHDPGWDLVLIGGELVVDLDQGRAHGLADIELDGDHAAVALGRGVNVLDARYLAHDPLQRLHGEVTDLLGRGPGVLHHDVDHGHRDLRIFLPRRHDQAEQAHHEHGDIEER